MEIRIPNLSEGVDSGTVVAVLVSEGDTIEKDQTILELETEKAVAPIPSSNAGKVTKILMKEGDKVNVGQAILVVEGGEGASAPAPTQTQEPVQAQAPATQARSAGQAPYVSPSGFAPPASPRVRQMARELGIDLTRVRGSESGGRISNHDLRDYIQGLQSGAVQSAPAAVAQAPVSQPKPSVDFEKWGSVRKEKMSSLRKTIGKVMHANWNNIPHISQFDDADMTNLLALRKKLLAKAGKGEKLTVTAFMIKAVVKALKELPIFNASIDEATEEIVYKEYFHLGIAVDTPAGLIVPVLKDVDKKSLKELSVELAELAQKTRDRKVAVEDLKGGTFTISNLGGIGGTYFTPIINAPEVAILALGKSVMRPVVTDDKGTIEAKMILPVGVSYDHRVIDGADGARFIRSIVEAIENLSEKDLGV